MLAIISVFTELINAYPHFIQDKLTRCVTVQTRHSQSRVSDGHMR